MTCDTGCESADLIDFDAGTSVGMRVTIFALNERDAYWNRPKFIPRKEETRSSEDQPFRFYLVSAMTCALRALRNRRHETLLKDTPVRMLR